MKPWLVCVSVGVTSAAVTFSVLTALHVANSLGAPPPRRHTSPGDPVYGGEMAMQESLHDALLASARG
ncbi:hypothetical protein [Saccharopolyspora gloriosae]|uniref:hypothetical protein n=1 Tax=Saccharopolyspora gloriosae TaxID=455344 RepID=UPI001FB5E7C9|nr:hypothetical protein [Saccharopolyspora gloriosae]